MDKKLTSLLAYVTFIGWIIAFVAGDKEGAKFHLNQGLTVALLELAVVVIGLVFGWIPVVKIISGILCGLIWVASVLLSVLGIFNVLENKEAELPFVGKYTFLK